jgi:hypothetical protein
LYGEPGDDVYIGDWDSTGTSTPMIRRGNTFYVSNSTGAADTVFSYGDAGDTVLVGDWNGDGSPWITFTVDSITRDPACTRDTRQPPTSGHFVAVAVTVTQVGPTPAGESPFSMYYGDWHVVSPAGVRDNDNNTFPAYTCLTDAQKLPYTDLQQGITLRGVIVLDTAQTSGHVTYTPSETAPQGWDWRSDGTGLQRSRRSVRSVPG